MTDVERKIAELEYQTQDLARAYESINQLWVETTLQKLIICSYIAYNENRAEQFEELLEELEKTDIEEIVKDIRSSLGLDLLSLFTTERLTISIESIRQTLKHCIK